MTANKILTVAKVHFSTFGYEGASLSAIAEQVGIKKSSLYAHFKSKEDIFFTCFDHAMRGDLSLLQEILNEARIEKSADQLLALLMQYGKKVHEHPDSMFCWRTIHFPPQRFREEVIERANTHIKHIGELLEPLFTTMTEEMRTISVDDAIEAYLCLFDGLMVELMYGGIERFERRLRASWDVFSHGLFNRKER